MEFESETVPNGNPDSSKKQHALAAIGIDAGAGVKSSDYGVFSRGPGGHKDGPETE
jgi:hypothetical protein